MPESKSPLENAILFLTAILFLSLGLACFAICCYRASLPFEIDPNEAWNAWWSKSLDHLYPSQDALVINNYPPPYFYLLKLGSLAGPDPDPIYTGRTISIFGVIALSVIVFSAIRILGASLSRAAFGAIWFFSSLNVAFMGYVGMNDPQLIAMTVMCGGFVWFAQRQEAGKAVEPAVLVMVAAGFFKHSIAAIPLSALIWLGMEDPKRALRASVSGLLAAGGGLLICYLYYGNNFIEQLLFSRALNFENVFTGRAVLHYLLVALAPIVLWLCFDWKNRLAWKMAVLLALTLGSGIVQRMGDGVDINSFFEFLFALALGLGLALNQTPQLSGILKRGMTVVRPALAFMLFPMLLLCFPKEAYTSIRSGAFRSGLAENAKTVQSEVKRVRAVPGKVSCTVMLVCYWAGKPFVWDSFALEQRVATGKWTQAELNRQARASGIRFVKIEDGTEWCDVWPCPSTLQ